MGCRPQQVRVYIACSLDGFIAGPGGDLSWLDGSDPSGDGPGAGAATGEGASEPPVDPGCLEFDDFMADVGAILMGRRTYDMVDSFGDAWPYGQCPVLVATHRSLDSGRGSVRAVSGEIGTLVTKARTAACGRDVYVDGGLLVRQSLDARLIDELIVTIAPVVLGSGTPLFAGASERHELDFTAQHRYGKMVQLRARLRPRGPRV